MNMLFAALAAKLRDKTGVDIFEGKEQPLNNQDGESEKIYIIPPDRIRYLAEIAESSASYTNWVNEQRRIAQQLYNIKGTIEITEDKIETKGFKSELEKIYSNLEEHLHPDCRRLLKVAETVAKYKADNFIYKVRDKEIKQPLYYTSLSQLKVPKNSAAQI